MQTRDANTTLHIYHIMYILQVHKHDAFRQLLHCCVICVSKSNYSDQTNTAQERARGSHLPSWNVRRVREEHRPQSEDEGELKIPSQTPQLSHFTIMTILLIIKTCRNVCPDLMGGLGACGVRQRNNSNELLAMLNLKMGEAWSQTDWATKHKFHVFVTTK